MHDRYSERNYKEHQKWFETGKIKIHFFFKEVENEAFRFHNLNANDKDGKDIHGLCFLNLL